MKRLVIALCAASLALVPAVSLAQPRDKDKDKKEAAKKPITNTNVEATEEINIPVGTNKTYPASDVKSFSAGDEKIAEVRLSNDSSQFVIVGKSAGSTTVLLIKKDGGQVNLIINVFARAPEVVKRELTQLLEGVPGLHVRQVGNRFFIEGGVNVEGEARRAQQIASLYNGQVESLVTVGAPAVDRKFNIRIDFFFVQYNKSSQYGVGISYPQSWGGANIQSNIQYDFLRGTATTAQASVVNHPLPGLDLAAKKGWAKVLKQSTVIMQNGTEGSFDSGGEQNFPVVSGLQANVYKIPFGTNVTVLPRYDAASGDMEIKLNADVSDLVPAVGATPLPGRNTSKLQTAVHMKLGQSLVLSGIRTQLQRRSSTGLPLLSEIPLVGALFGSQAGEREDIEGAVFIIPSVVEAVPRASVDLVEFAKKQYEKYSGDFDDVNAYEKKPPMPPAATPAGTTP